MPGFSLNSLVNQRIPTFIIIDSSVNLPLTWPLLHYESGATVEDIARQKQDTLMADRALPVVVACDLFLFYEKVHSKSKLGRLLS